MNGHGDDVHQRQDRGRVEKSLRRLPRSPHAPHERGERHDGEGTQHGERQQTGEEGSREIATPVPQSLEAAHEPIEAEVEWSNANQQAETPSARRARGPASTRIAVVPATAPVRSVRYRKRNAAPAYHWVSWNAGSVCGDVSSTSPDSRTLAV